MGLSGEMASPGTGDYFSGVPSKCPMFPKAVTPVRGQTLGLNRTGLLFAEVVSHPALHMQTEAWARVALEGTRRKRGPPSVRLS